MHPAGGTPEVRGRFSDSVQGLFLYGPDIRFCRVRPCAQSSVKNCCGLSTEDFQPSKDSAKTQQLRVEAPAVIMNQVQGIQSDSPMGYPGLEVADQLCCATENFVTSDMPTGHPPLICHLGIWPASFLQHDSVESPRRFKFEGLWPSHIEDEPRNCRRESR